MAESLHIYSDTRNLGDNLSMTPLMNCYPCIIHLPEDLGCREVAPIFEGLGEVVFDKSNWRDADQEHSEKPKERRVLDFYGLHHISALPVIRLTEQEISSAREFINQYSNPLVFKTNPRARFSERSIPEDVIAKIKESLSRKYTLINFAIDKSGNDRIDNTIVDGIINIFNLPIRFQAACYHVIGKYIGPDTGDYRLMLAVGGESTVLVPNNSYTYSYNRFHLKEPRVFYYNFNKSIDEILEKF